MNTLATSLLLACAGIVLAWALGRPARRFVGARPAFCLWGLPPLLAAVAWLPALPGPASGAAGVLTLPVLIVEPARASAAATLGVAQIAMVVWCIGVGFMLARLVAHCARLMRAAEPVPEDMRRALAHELGRLDVRLVRVHPAGPAVCLLPGCRLLLPADLLTRYTPAERRQILAHERVHLTRQDALWNTLAELMLAALWFFPPAWFALERFHLDQELACDAAILDHSPDQAGAYARALLAGCTSRDRPTLASAWLSRSQLKERLTMIQQHAQTRVSTRIGYATLITLLGGCALAAHAAMPAASALAQTPAPVASTPPPPPPIMVLLPPVPQSAAAPAPGTAEAIVDKSSRNAHPPRYPAAAVKRHEQGTVLLRVLVSTDGAPLKVQIQHSSGYASLDAAAVNAARRWKFHPAMADHRPVQGWVTVPVAFRLNPAKASSTARPPATARAPGLMYKLATPPRYPPDAIKNHESGTTILLVLISAEGKPLETKMAKSSGHASLDAAAREAVAHWTFTPALVHGKPHKAWARVPVVFAPDVVKVAPGSTAPPAKH